MSKLKVKLFLAAIFLITAACSLLPAGAKLLSPTPQEPTRTAEPPTAVVATRVVEKNVQPTKTPGPARTATTGDPMGILKQVPDKLNALKSYRIKGQVTGGTDPLQDGPLLMEVISPDKAHLSLPSFEFYSIGTTAYYKFGANATWMKGAQVNPGRNPLGVAVLDPRQMIANAIKQAGANTGEPADLNGMPMLLFTYTATASDPNSSSGSLWVGVADGLPYKLLDLEQDGTNVELELLRFQRRFQD